jgi:FkbM family methyltransferase
MILNRIGELLPTSISRGLIPVYIYISRITGTNAVSYSVSGREVQFIYDSEEQFLLMYKIIDQNKICAENISLEYLQEISECDCFIDVGAYHGLYSLIVGKLYEDVDIYSFEPNEINRQVLTQTLGINDINSDIRNEVITNTSGEIKFYERPNDLSEGHSTAKYRQSEVTIKKSLTLSDLFIEEGIKNPYIKLDAEGEEYNILRDISECSYLSSISGIVEVHPDKMDADMDEIINLFKENKYDWEHIGDTTGPDMSPRPAFFFSD